MGLGLLSFVALVPLLAGIDAGPRPRTAASAGLLCGLLFFCGAFLWVPLAGFRGALLAVTAGYVCVLASTLSVFAGALAWLRRHDRALFFAAAPLLWIVGELLRSEHLLGYPWHHLGYALSAHPSLIQLAALGGVHALSLWIVAVNTTLVGVRSSPRTVVPVLAILFGAPPLLDLRVQSTDPEDLVRIAAVQPQVFEPGRSILGRFQTNLRTLVDLTDEAVHERPELVVWPESAFERPIGSGEDPFLGGIAHHYGTPLLTGVWRVASGSEGSPYNSAVLARPDGSVALAGDKVHPVPFYEGTPVSLVQRELARFVSWPGRFQRGRRPGLIEFGKTDGAPVAAGILICFDSSFPSLVRDLRQRGARLLVEISNEARIGRWSAVQHALVSRVRAVESGAPLVRVANTGPTEWIDARGRLVARINPGSSSTRTAAVALAHDPPPYVWLGEVPVLVAGLLPILVLGLRRASSGLRLWETELYPSIVRDGKETNR